MIFSIAVPVFKQAEFLPTALASITAQSSSYQLAVMDATPDDSVQKVLAGYANRLHYSRHGPDQGQAAAIQEGWDHTTEEILCWLCADDYLFPNAFEEVEKVFCARPDVDVVYGDSVFVSETGEFIRYFPSISSDISRIVRDCCVSQPSCFVRRAAVERVGRLNTDLHYIMDWDLWTRLYKNESKFYYLQKPLSATRIYPGTKTTSNAEKRLSEIRSHLEQHTGYFSALRSRVGTRLASHDYPELEGGASSSLEHTFLAALSSLRRIKVFLSGSMGPNGRKTLYGLDVVANQVRGRCEIYLPVYGNRLPSVLVITSERNVRLTASVNGSCLLVGHVRPYGPLYRHVFELSNLQIHRSNLFCINIESGEQVSWKLVSVHLE